MSWILAVAGRSRIAALIAVVFAVLSLCGCRHPDIVELPSAEYQWGDEPTGEWRRAAPLTLTGRGDGRMFWLRFTPPPVAAPDAALHMDRGWWVDQVRVNGRVIAPEGCQLFVPYLPGDEILVRARAPVVGIIPITHVGSMRALWIRVLDVEGPVAIVAGAMVIAGVLLLTAGLRRRTERTYRGLGLFLFSVGVVTLLNLRTLAPTLGMAGDRAIVLHELATFLYPFGFVEFILAAFGDGPWRVLRRGVAIFAAVTVICWTLHVVGVVHVLLSRSIVAPFTVVFVVQGIVLAWRSARGGDAAARMFLFGIAALMVLSLPELLGGTMLLYVGMPTVPLAILAFAGAMMAVIERRYRAAQDGLALQVHALEEKNREVGALNQELRHQIAERSKQLSSFLAQAPASLSSRRLAEGDAVDGRYRVLRVIGRGAMGRCMRSSASPTARGSR